MSIARSLAACLLCCTWAASAAPAGYLTLDKSNATLIDAATAAAVWKDQIPLRMFKLYPVGKWGFASEVEGGFDDANVCIVTARVMLLPRNGKSLVFAPAKAATAFGMQSGASAEQCRALAKVKLGESIAAVRSALLPR
jgi:hypothetical protein